MKSMGSPGATGGGGTNIRNAPAQSGKTPSTKGTMGTGSSKPMAKGVMGSGSGGPATAKGCMGKC